MPDVTVSTEPETVNLREYGGDSWAETFSFLTDGTPVDLTGVTVTSSVRNTLGELTELQANVTGPGQVQIAPPETGLPADRYWYDVQFDDAGQVLTRVKGWLRVYQDTTDG